MSHGVRLDQPCPSLVLKISSGGIEEVFKRRQVVDVFRKFDANGDGVIDRKELGHALKKMDKSWNKARLDRLFRVVDTSCDGQIDYEEFVMWIFATPHVSTKDLQAFRAAALSLYSKACHVDGSSKKRSTASVNAEEGEWNLNVSGHAIQSPSPLEPVCDEAHMVANAIHPADLPKGLASSKLKVPLDASVALIKKQINLRITGMAGNEIGTVDGVDVTTASGQDLKKTIANSFGFPAFNMRLLLTNGEFIGNGPLVAQSNFCKVSDDSCEDYLPVCCILSTNRPVGHKFGSGPRCCVFGTKAGMLLASRLESSSFAKQDTDLISTLRVPEFSFRDEAQCLLKESFAPHLAPLIDMGFDAAYHSASDAAGAEELATSTTMFVYTDDEHGVSADLSTCQLWTRKLTEHAMSYDVFGHLLSDLVAPHAAPPSVMNAVLWRLVFGWEGSPATAPGGTVRPGPVLEVLFLATMTGYREKGQARVLVKELEEAAMALGCSAVAVAAVPGQGISFWKRNGYTEVVPLAAQEALGDPGPGEAVTPLGDFLLNHMLLFTDTPLVAKVLA